MGSKRFCSLMALLALSAGAAGDVTIEAGDVVSLTNVLRNIGSYGNVYLKPGTYDVSTVPVNSGTCLSVSAGGHELIGLGADPSETVLVGGGRELDRRVISLAAGAVIRNLTVKNGGYSSSNKDGGGVSGGAAYDCIISDNYTTRYGGGADSMELHNCTITRNDGGNGGGAARLSAAYDCTFLCNTSHNPWAENGGGAFFFTSRSCVLDGCTFERNFCAAYAGAIAVGNYSGSFLATNCVFRENRGKYGGSAIYGKYEAPTIVVADCQFYTNVIAGANSAAGGAVSLPKANSVLRRCHFEGNSSDGSGGAVSGSNCEDCTFVGNRAVGNYGGAVSGSGFLTGCEFRGNQGRAAGAVYSCLAITNCVFTGNRCTEGYEQQGAGAVWMTAANGVISGSSFTNNVSGGYYGVVRVSGAHAQITNCVFAYNSGYYGGIVGRKASDAATTAIDVVGCVFHSNSNVTCVGTSLGSLVDSTFTGNVDDAGGVASTAPVPVLGCTFTGNVATKGSGGALNSPGVVSNCTFTGNIVCAEAVKGAAVYNPAAVYDSVFTDNVASNGSGGGVAFEASYAGPGAFGCTFRNNQARGWRYGGAVCCLGATPPVLSNCTFVGRNTCGSSRGQIVNGAKLIGCTVRDYVGDGYALANCDLVNCFVTNNVFTGNLAFDALNTEIKAQSDLPHYSVNTVYAGNVISNAAGNATALLCNSKRFVNCTFADNWRKDATGNGLVGDGCPLVNCLFADNRRGATALDVTSAAIATNCLFTATGKALDQFAKASGCRIYPREKIGLAADGCSLARRNKARDAAFVDDDIRALVGTEDALGNARFSGRGLDIGAVECNLVPYGMRVIFR